MPKKKQQTQVSLDQVVAHKWGNIKEYMDKVEVISETKAVQEGSTFLTDLGIHICTVH